MTDPNVIEAVRKLAEAVRTVSKDCEHDRAIYATGLASEADALLAAEKPGGIPALAVERIRSDREEMRRSDDLAAKVEAAKIAAGRAVMGAAEKPAEAAPAAPALPWVIRHEDGKVIAAFDDEQFARDCADRCNLPPFFRVAAAPTVAAVKFTDDGDAFGTDWEATRSSAKDSVFVTITLRPGEDAGVTTERTLAAVGMGS